MTDILHHYKDREPEETIQIIEQFFTKRNIKIHKLHSFHSDINTFSCAYRLEWHYKSILQANGKGETELYAKASCFAELYERFCLYAHVQGMNNKFFIRAQQKYNYKTFGFHEYPDEKYLSNKELLEDFYMKDFLTNILPDISEETINQFRAIFHENFLYGNRYENLYNPKEIKYKNLRLISQYIGTTGTAAGNTIEETLVQALSELYERYAIQLIYTAPYQEKYYYIEPQYLNPKFQKYIQFLKQEYNLEARVYDLSYNFNIPVCLLLIINKQNHTFILNFGSSPIFDIAVERCFTEIYQGWNTLPQNYKLLIRPNDIPYQEACRDAFQSCHKHKKIIIPEQLILRNAAINTYNSNIFINNKTATNKELLNRLTIIGLKNNFKLYWTDISLTDKIKAVHILFDEQRLVGYIDFTQLQHLSKKQQNLVLKTSQYIFNSIDKAITQYINEN